MYEMCNSELLFRMTQIKLHLEHIVHAYPSFVFNKLFYSYFEASKAPKEISFSQRLSTFLLTKTPQKQP